MRTWKKQVGAVFASLVFAVVPCQISSCGGSRESLKETIPDFHDYRPCALLVVPVFNETPDLDAPVVIRPLVARFFAERGYYVIPPLAVDTILVENGVFEAGQITKIAPQKLGGIFGADGILYVNIKDWSTKYAVVASAVTVSVEGVMLHAATGREIWRAERTVSETPRSSGGNSSSVFGAILGAVVQTAVHAAITPYRPIAERAVANLARALPTGPYLDKEKD